MAPLAALRGGRLWRLWAAVFVLIAALLGLLVCLYFGPPDSDHPLFLMSMMALHAVLLVASLGFLQWSGLRLMPGKVRKSDQP